MLATIRIGTRGSKLALWQAEWTASQLRNRGHDVELIVVSTHGDVTSQSLAVVGGQGLFVKEIQQELLAGTVDVAVHSLKDLPTKITPGLCLAAVPARESTDDCLISREGLTFEQLPAGARVGTGSSRRGSQLLAWRPDIQIVDIRGNVDSRLRKLDEGNFEAIILAAAGLVRLKLLQHVTEYLPRDRVLPAVGQGALGLECRANDSATQSALKQLDDNHTRAAVLAERSFLAALSGGCLAPIAAIGGMQPNGLLQLSGRVLAVDGSRKIEGCRAASPTDAIELGEQLAAELLAQGASELINSVRHEGESLGHMA